MNKALDTTLLGLSSSDTGVVLRQLYRLLPNIRFSEEGLDDTSRLDVYKNNDDHELQSIIQRIFRSENQIFVLIAAYADNPEVLGVFDGITKKLMPPYDEDYNEFDSKTILKKLLRDSGSSDFYFLIFDKKYIKDTKEQYQRSENKKIPAVAREFDKQQTKRRIAYFVNMLENLTKDTDFEYDNFLKIADSVLKKSKDKNQLLFNLRKLPYSLNLFAHNTTKQREINDNFNSLVGFLADLKYPHLAGTFNLQDVNRAERKYEQVAKTNNYDYYALDLNDMDWSYKDASGYKVDLARYLKKKIKLNSATPERALARAEKTYQDYENFLNWLKPKIDELYVKRDFMTAGDLTQKLKTLHDLFLTAEAQTNALSDGSVFGEEALTDIFGLWMSLSQEIYSIKHFIINN